MQYGFHLSSLPDHQWSMLAPRLLEMGYGQVTARVQASWLSDDARERSLLTERFMGLRALGLDFAIDGDGRFLMDPCVSSVPRLARAEENQRRETMLTQLIDFAGSIGCRLVTFSVGEPEVTEELEHPLKRIAVSIGRLIVSASDLGVTLGIKPELGSVVETSSHFRRLLEWLPTSIADQRLLGWAPDIALMAQRGEMPISDRLGRDIDRLVCVYLSDFSATEASELRTGEQPFGRGDLAVGRIARSLEEFGFRGPLILRCEGHHALGLEIARGAIESTKGKTR
jgi:sugar phosphate isomerase/epimerase